MRGAGDRDCKLATDSRRADLVLWHDDDIGHKRGLKDQRLLHAPGKLGARREDIHRHDKGTRCDHSQGQFSEQAQAIDRRSAAGAMRMEGEQKKPDVGE